MLLCPGNYAPAFLRLIEDEIRVLSCSPGIVEFEEKNTFDKAEMELLTFRRRRCASAKNKNVWATARNGLTRKQPLARDLVRAAPELL